MLYLGFDERKIRRFFNHYACRTFVGTAGAGTLSAHFTHFRGYRKLGHLRFKEQREDAFTLMVMPEAGQFLLLALPANRPPLILYSTNPAYPLATLPLAPGRYRIVVVGRDASASLLLNAKK
jgi:hypothetical protein